MHAMYDHKLDTFCLSAELLSFSQAAERLFITPSAVIQQMNNLEKQLECQLFIRSHHGLVLTEVGKFFYQEIVPFMEQGKQLQKHIHALGDREYIPIQVGVNSFHPVRLLYELWQQFHVKHSKYQFITKEFSSNENSLDLPDVDIVEGAHFQESWQKDFFFLPYKKTALCVAVPQQHMLAKHQCLTFAEVAASNVMLIRRSLDGMIDALRDRLEAQGTNIITVEIYNVDAVLRCLQENCALVLPECWCYLHPNLVMLPVDWEYALAYGFFLRKQPVREMSVLHDFLKQQS